MIEFIHKYHCLITNIATVINILLFGAWIWLFIRQRKTNEFLKTIEPNIETWHKEILRSNNLFEAYAKPQKVYLVWLIGDDDYNSAKALIGCCRSEEAAHKYADGKEHLVQEIDII